MVKATYFETDVYLFRYSQTCPLTIFLEKGNDHVTTTNFWALRKSQRYELQIWHRDLNYSISVKKNSLVGGRYAF